MVGLGWTIGICILTGYQVIFYKQASVGSTRLIILKVPLKPIIYVSNTVWYIQNIRNLKSPFLPLIQCNGEHSKCLLHTYSTENLSSWAGRSSSHKDEASRDRQINNILE